MLSVEQLRAMPPSARAGYLRQCEVAMRAYDRSAPQARAEAKEARALAHDLDVMAEAQEREAAEIRASLSALITEGLWDPSATLEAAGLWPVTGGEEGKCAG